MAGVNTMLMTPEDYDEQVKVSLKKLQTDYVDLLLMHFPMAIVASN